MKGLFDRLHFWKKTKELEIELIKCKDVSSEHYNEINEYCNAMVRVLSGEADLELEFYDPIK